MANLRDLIDSTNRSGIQTSQTLAAVGIATANPPGFPGSAYKQIKYRNRCYQSTSQGHFECYVWKPPTGTTFIKFEIWGGGGSGAGTCCCMFGQPGGAGAYAYKCICTGYDLGGCQYEFCVGGGSCVSPDSYGYRGCKTFINGHGLDNFCAEGGAPGYTSCHCSFPQSCMCCYEPSCAEGYRFNGSCQYTTAAWCWYCYWGCSDIAPGPWGQGVRDCFDLFKKLKNNNCGSGNIYACDGVITGYYDLIGIGNTFGSCGKRVSYGHAVNPCYGGLCQSCVPMCAPYFGADGGAIGLPGWVGTPCNMDMGDFCMILQYSPYPGGLINTNGGWIPYRLTSMNQSGPTGQPNRTNNFFGYNGSNRDHGIPGMGGLTSASTGGNCYCGGYGHPGQVIITYG